MRVLVNGLIVIVPSTLLALGVGYLLGGWTASVSIGAIVLTFWLAGLVLRMRAVEHGLPMSQTQRIRGGRITLPLSKVRLALAVALVGELLGLLGDWLFGGGAGRLGLLSAFAITALALVSALVKRESPPNNERTQG